MEEATYTKWLTHPDCEPLRPTTFYVERCVVEDNSHQLDDLPIAGAAQLLGGRLDLPTYAPPPHLDSMNHMMGWYQHWHRNSVLRSIEWTRAQPLGQTIVDKAVAAISTVREELGVPSMDDLVLRVQVNDESGGYALFDQSYDGVPIYSAGVTVGFSREGRIKSISSRCFPAPSGGVIPIVSSDIAQETVRGVLGAEYPSMARLVLYPGEAPNSTALCWLIAVDAWHFFVSATSGAIEGVAKAVVKQYPGQVWVPNPMVVLGNPNLRSTGSNDCQGSTYNGAYSTVTLRDLALEGGIPQLRNLRTRVVEYDGVQYPIPEGTFIFPRCDPQKGFEQVMGFYSVDEGQYYIQNRLGLIFNSGGQSIDPLGFISRYIPPPIDMITLQIPGVTEDAEDLEVALHEYGHSLNFDLCDTFALNDQEGFGVTEGFADFFSTVAFTHEPAPFDRVWGEWSAQDPWGATYGLSTWYGRIVANNQLYPHDWHQEQHLAGLVWAGALWDVFKAYEGVFGICPTQVGPTGLFGNCPARDLALTAILGAHRSGCSAPNLANIAASIVKHERESSSPNVALLNGIVNALDRRGHFFDQQRSPWGADYLPLQLAHDQSIGAPQVVRMQISNPTYPIDVNSVRLYYAKQGDQFAQFSTMIHQGGGIFEGSIPVLGANSFIRYMVEATNQLGVKTHWPKSVPFPDAAMFLVFNPMQRATYSCNCALPIVLSAPGSIVLNATSFGSGAISDVNCHLSIEGSDLEYCTVELSNGSVSVNLFKVPNFNGYGTSSIGEFDWWFDDEQDAPYNQVRNISYLSSPAALNAFDGQPVAANWALTIANSTEGQPVTVRAYEIQVSKGILVSVNEEANSSSAHMTGLQKCFPNPFRGSTTIPFTVEKTTPVEIRIYEATGRVVRKLKTLSLPAGAHSLTWDGRDEDGDTVHSGVYFYELLALGKRFERKLVVVR